MDSAGQRSSFLPPSFIPAFSCSLNLLQLHVNNLRGFINADITTLSRLEQIGLAFNSLTGPIPEGLGAMPNLSFLDVNSNHLVGTLPSSLCNQSSPLSVALFSQNKLEGNLDLSECSNLFFFDVSHNKFNGTPVGPKGRNRLHTLILSSTLIEDATGLLSGGFVSNINLDYSPQSSNILDVVANLQSLVSFSANNLAFCPECVPYTITATIPPNLFSIVSLKSFSISNQYIYKTLPEITYSTSLTSLVFLQNGLSGTIPASFVTYLAKRGTALDLRFNYLSCCAIGELQDNTDDYYNLNASWSVWYKEYNYSAPRLPPGLKFSKSLQLVSLPQFDAIHEGSMFTLGNATYPGLLCPYLLRDGQDDIQSNFLYTWYIDPEYYLFEGCQCSPGLVMTWKMQKTLRLPQCVAPSPPSNAWWVSMWWILLIIVVIGLSLLVLSVWLSSRGRRPRIIQEIMDAQRRAKGPPISGQVSIVTTDIEGFSSLMQRNPELMIKAIILHNNLIQKATHTNFGAILEQEGDAYALLFEKPADAVKFCCQAQLLMASVDWPKGLLDRAKSSDVHQSRRRSLVLDVASPLSSMFLKQPATSARSKMNSVSFLTRSSLQQAGVEGLKVRMGVATGHLLAEGQSAALCPAFALAKLIGDAASGGQILMCEETFRQVKDITDHLGCVDENGFSPQNMESQSLEQVLGLTSREQKKEKEAVLLDMGEWLWDEGGVKDDPSLSPLLITALDLKASALGQPSSDLQPNTVIRRRMRVYQVLIPKLIHRGRMFGGNISTKVTWKQSDRSYFDAPGALFFSLGPGDKVVPNKRRASSLASPFATASTRVALTPSPPGGNSPYVCTAFVLVDGGKGYASKHPKDASELHFTLVALIASLLSQLPGSYFTRHQEDCLKYMLAFNTYESAIIFAATLQQACLYAPWPRTALRFWPEEKDEGPETPGSTPLLLFRGPRLKVGLAGGIVSHISPEHSGRADYHGHNVNMAARYMDAAAHGGQVACDEQELAAAFVSLSSEIEAFLGPSNSPEVDDNKETTEDDEQELLFEIHAPDPTVSFALGAGGTSGQASKSRNDSGLPSPSAQTCSPRAWTMPDEDLLVPGEFLEILASPLGDFEFKGNTQPLPMVNLHLSVLSNRKFPKEGPKGKGARVRDPKEGIPVLKSRIPLLKILQQMKEAYQAGGAQRDTSLHKSPSRQVSRAAGALSRLFSLKEDAPLDEDSETHPGQGSSSAFVSHKVPRKRGSRIGRLFSFKEEGFDAQTLPEEGPLDMDIEEDRSGQGPTSNGSIGGMSQFRARSGGSKGKRAGSSGSWLSHMASLGQASSLQQPFWARARTSDLVVSSQPDPDQESPH